MTSSENMTTVNHLRVFQPQTAILLCDHANSTHTDACMEQTRDKKTLATLAST